MKKTFWVLTIFIMFCFGFYPEISAYAPEEDYQSKSTVPTGNWECWDDGSIDPCKNTLNDLENLNSSQIWAVGDIGTVIHFDGSNWEKTNLNTEMNILSLSFVNTTNGWAAGEGGEIYMWNGTSWDAEVSPTTQSLNDIHMISLNDGWAVGNAGTILHWNGSSWNIVNSTVSEDLNAIGVVTSDNIWAMGDSGVILRWNGSVWSTMSSPTTEDLYAVSFYSANNGWAGGDNLAILEWDGNSWVNNMDIIDYGDTINAITFDGAGNPIIGGKANSTGVIYHRVLLEGGAYWGWEWDEDYNLINYSGNVNAMVQTSDNGLWVIGSGGVIFQKQGDVWTSVSKKNVIDSYYTVAVPNREFGFINGNGAKLHQWDGTNWNSTENIISGLAAADISADNIWYAGDYLDHWNGNAFESASFTPPDFLLGIDFVSETEGWAVGNSGVIVHGTGLDWSSQTSPTSNLLRKVDMLSATEGWAVGSSGTIIRWDGISWSNFSSPTTNMLYSIAMTSNDDGWIGGDNILLRWNGTSWSIFPQTSLSTISDIGFVNGEFGWAVGRTGVILQWNGMDWVELPKITSNRLVDLDIVSSGEAWAVGENGVILHFVADLQLTINYPNGAPGSYFSVYGSFYPADSTANLYINEHLIGSVPVDGNGMFTVILSTDEASIGSYLVRATVNPSASTQFELIGSAPVRSKEDEGLTLDVPEGIGVVTNNVYIPMIMR